MVFGKASLSALVVVGSLVSSSLSASVIAVVDTGVDLNHKIFSKRAFINHLEIAQNGVDEDQNGMVDDVTGWSFVDGSPLSFDNRLLNDLPEEVYKMQQIIEKLEAAEASSDEIAWFRKAYQDPHLMDALDFYLGLSHGTHVAGISVKGNQASEVLSVKYLGPANKDDKAEESPTQPLEGGEVNKVENAPLLAGKPMEEVWPVIASSLYDFAKSQGEEFTQMALYVQKNGDVVNGSFGSSPRMPQVMQMLAGFFHSLTGRMPTGEEYRKMAFYLYNQEASFIKATLDQLDRTLFVFAAGNDNSDNDVIPVTPANHGSENALTVAATVGRSSLADFSNYGAKTVDVAAPGSGILSSAPGKLSFLRMSGTSQAAPYVSNTALKMIDANPAYFAKSLNKRAQVLKKLIMATVDKKEWLKGKVVSEGIVNQERAVYAAKLLGKMSLEDAAALALQEVSELSDPRDLHASNEWASLGLKPIVAPMGSGIRGDAKIKLVVPKFGQTVPQI